MLDACSQDSCGAAALDAAGPDGPPPADGPPPTADGPLPTTDGPPPTADGPLPTTDGPLPTADGPLPTTDGPLPTADGPLPTADGSLYAYPPVFGLTITDPWGASATGGGIIGTRLRELVGPSARKPTVRVVLDEGMDLVFMTWGDDATAYVPVVTNIEADAQVMGELLDSLYVPDYDVDQYTQRACEYRSVLGHLVDIWEVGNEVNGEWLGSLVQDKIAAAVQVFTADKTTFESSLCAGFSLQANEKPFKLALTLYYNGIYNNGVASNDNCWQQPGHAMLYWTAQNFSSPGTLAGIAGDFDYVLVSYYEDDCLGIQPEWQDLFAQLGTIFPGAQLGIGECGTTQQAKKVDYVERYYHGIDSANPIHTNMHVSHPGYVGGNFWWYFCDDLNNTPVIDKLKAALVNPFFNR